LVIFDKPTTDTLIITRAREYYAKHASSSEALWKSNTAQERAIECMASIVDILSNEKET